MPRGSVIRNIFLEYRIEHVNMFARHNVFIYYSQQIKQKESSRGRVVTKVMRTCDTTPLKCAHLGATGIKRALFLWYIKVVPDSPAYVQKCFIF